MRNGKPTTVTFVSISTLVLLFCVDRISKLWAFNELFSPRVWIDGVLQLRFVPNTNIAFVVHVPTWLSSLLVAVVLIAVVSMVVRAYQHQQHMLVAALSLIVIGAFSNLLDRLQYGFVIDFIDVPFWSVFNLADAYIVFGIIGVCSAARLDKKPETVSL